jgi:molybdopterin-containing oxidoreductase family iron-sulfur binding subunit
MKRQPLDPALLRDSLAEAQGKRYWRSLEELAGDPRVRELIEREFPDGAATWDDPVSRRRFLSLLGASLALAGLAGTGCSRPTGTILPYVKQPENLTLGKPLFYATAMSLGGFATGLLVKSHEGRPTKIEGNDKHPASLGATLAYHQAAILGLYDPDRSQSVMFREQPRAWSSLVEELRDRLNPKGERGKGQGLAVLSETVGSPTLLAQKDEFLAAYPEARWFSYEPVNGDNARAGAQMAFGRPYHSYAKLTDADVIVSLDADFLGQGPASPALTRQFATRRREDAPGGMNRLYAVETDLTITGGRADHRLAVRPSQVETVARTLAGILGVAGFPVLSIDEALMRWIDAVAKDLKARKPGATAVLVGDGQPPLVHAIAHTINAQLKNLGKTILFTEPLPQALSTNTASLRALTEAIDQGEVRTLLLLGGNPVYTAPADVPLAARLRTQLARQPRDKWLAVHVGPYFDETSLLCHWHVPQSHFLEEWSDGVAFDGTAAIVQPLIAPLYGSKSLHEVLAALTPTEGETGGYDTRTGYEIVRAYWKTHRPAAEHDFERYWQTALHDGVLKGTALPTMVPTLALAPPAAQEKTPEDTLELSFVPDPAIHDGRFANNGWLQEWPRPLTRLSWDNALLMSPATAKNLGVSTHINLRKGGEHGDTIADVVVVQLGKYYLGDVPVWIVPGHADDAVTLHLGYGRSRAGRVGTQVGVNANALRTSTTPGWFAPAARVSKLRSRTHQLACQQAHHGMEGRDIVLSGTVEENKDKNSPFRKALATVRHEKHELPTLYAEAAKREHAYTGYKWGMAVDLSKCTGCGACVVACQAENNVPVVGKEQVLRAREMHWLRIDRYFESPADEGKEDQLRVHFQPVMCQHCENAPCELVCPVEATVHGDEGTNDMVYNRCVGTRYCANNCPYKVRRFNFFQYTDYETPSLKLLWNPEVTVRTRGVMEKCTFCIQRISHARIEASKQAVAGDPKRKDPAGRTVQGKAVAYIQDEDIYTACEAACPAEAITFGDLNDRQSEVAKLREKTTGYDLLGELGTRPRVFYLASLRNPNPALAEV